MPPTSAALRAACLNWLDRPELHTHAIAATLNFRRSIDGFAMCKGVALAKRVALTTRDSQLAVGHWLHCLDLLAYGKGEVRRGRTLGAIPISEGGVRATDDPFHHYHVLMQVPEHEELASWRLIAAAQWNRVRWAAHPRDNRFRDVTDAGWLDYILKERTKSDFIDAVDLENLRVN